MKKLTGVLASALAVSALVGCSAGSDKENKEEVKQEQTVTENQVAGETVADLMTKVKEQIAADYKSGGIEEEVLIDGELSGYMEIDLLSDDETAAMFLEKMAITKDYLEEGRILLPMMNVKSDQIIILKAKDESKLEILQQGLLLAKEDQIAAWSTYLPAQLEKVENNIIETNGDYLMYITYDTPEAIKEVLVNK